MTYHYLELAYYQKFKVERLVALNRAGEDVTPRTDNEQINLWNAQVLNYSIADDMTMYATLDR